MAGGWLVGGDRPAVRSTVDDVGSGSHVPVVGTTSHESAVGQEWSDAAPVEQASSELARLHELEQPETGDADVDAIVARVAAVNGGELRDHAQVFEAVHRDLQDLLAAAED